jgi:hypothetical protein
VTTPKNPKNGNYVQKNNGSSDSGEKNLFLFLKCPPEQHF